MTKTSCEICGAVLPADGVCSSNVPQDSAPWQGDYSAMAEQKMTHLQHQVSVARWMMHHPDNQSPKALDHAKKLTAEHAGVDIPLFPLD